MGAGPPATDRRAAEGGVPRGRGRVCAGNLVLLCRHRRRTQRRPCPVDNLQLSPTESRADRTSPTNIGLYLLAVCAANDFGFIGDGELAERVGRTVSAVERLDKYAGNLYNWYTLPGGKILGSPYVSAVDSGNFVTCLVALETLLREEIA